ncbi:hypothetical protein [Amycolatopsis nigrescens]|uniref:hypothetical protein n=1 Tax=Amycolatopsis nigrescens TaxID=381445 RepID=UPI00037F04CD|nr:hypothetical protein [Amycolatopsis nigrescens]
MTEQQRKPNRQLAALMREAGVSNKGLSRRMFDWSRRDQGDPISPSHTSIAKYLSGQIARPTARACQVMAKVLGAQLGRPVALHEIGYPDVAPEAVDTTLQYPETITDSITALTQLTKYELTSTDAAAKLLVVPEAWASLLVKSMYGSDEEVAIVHEPVELSPVHIQEVHDATEMFSTFDHRYGGGKSKPLIAQYLEREVLPLIPRVSASSPLGRNYFQAVASLTLRAGWTAYDSGEHARAQRFLYQAYRLARAAGDRAFSGHVLGCMSHQANFLGHFEDAVHLARAAVHHGETGGATPTTMALFYAMKARALASQGNEKEATRALLAAESWLGASNPADDPDWVWYFDSAELHAEFAHCFRDLGNAGLANQHAMTSIAESKDVFVRSLSFCNSVLATSHLLANDIDQAVEVACSVVDTAVTLNSYRVISYLNEFRGRLAPYDSAATRTFDDYFSSKGLLKNRPAARGIIIP